MKLAAKVGMGSARHRLAPGGDLLDTKACLDSEFFLIRGPIQTAAHAKVFKVLLSCIGLFVLAGAVSVRVCSVQSVFAVVFFIAAK